MAYNNNRGNGGGGQRGGGNAKKGNSGFEKIGALWKKQSQNNPDFVFLSGSIEVNGQKIFLNVMKNTFKGKPGTNENAPDYVISTPVDGPQQSNQGFKKPAATGGKRNPPQRQNNFNTEQPQEPENTDEVPEADF